MPFGPKRTVGISLMHGLLLCSSEQKRAGAGGSQWKLWKTLGNGGRHVGDREGVGRGVEGCGKVQKRREGTESNGTLQSTIMTVLWPAISNQSDSDSHFESGVGAPFRPTCFDLYTVHFARTTQTDTLYSVQELSNCPTRTCCFTTTL